MSFLQTVLAHLGKVSADPSLRLDERLLEKVDGQVSEQLSESDRDALIHQLAELVPKLQQDASPATRLIEILIRSSSYTFSRVQDIRPPVDFQAGLLAPSFSINLVTLSLLEKAALKKSDAGIVAGQPDIVSSLVRSWLSTPDTAVAQKAHHVLLGLLTATDEGQTAETRVHQNHYEPFYQSLMWRRIFKDKDIYALLFSLCDLATAGQQGQLNRREKTIAQARLLDWLVRVDCEPVRTSQIPEVEMKHGVKDGGILDFAATDMVDREDVLMHMTLIDFFAELIKPDHSMVQSQHSSSSSQSSQSSQSLDFLINRGLHSRSLSYFLEAGRQSGLDATYLYGRSANYLSVYSSCYPTHFLAASPSIADATVRRVSDVLGAMSPGRWAQGQAPIHDLHVLASLPRLVHLPRAGVASPIFDIPVVPASPDAFKVLATIFNGPRPENRMHSHRTEDELISEARAARAIYFLYLSQRRTFWNSVIKAAETVALKEVALAAIGLIDSIINAHWEPLPRSNSQSTAFFPTESELADKCNSAKLLPPSGILAILAQPALGAVLPYLIRPGQTFSNLVGGGRGDVESAAYVVAAAKYDTIIRLRDKMKEIQQDTGEFGDAIATVNKRLALGVMGGNSEIGGRIQSLEL
ncbi:MAG: hypothetical protein LQ342_003408 [Letrouitia transgressa]|nr:MAG: hypothetical protein LQ342_003408 [Letrouitia transgressa]